MFYGGKALDELLGDPLSWRIGDPSYAGTEWSVKNLFELKNARRVLVDGNIFQWYVLRDVRDLNVRAVIVKGGKTSNVYVYPGGDYSDGGLSAPTNPKNGKPADLGAVSVCFDPA